MWTSAWWGSAAEQAAQGGTIPAAPTELTRIAASPKRNPGRPGRAGRGNLVDPVTGLIVGGGALIWGLVRKDRDTQCSDCGYFTCMCDDDNGCDCDCHDDCDHCQTYGCDEGDWRGCGCGCHDCCDACYDDDGAGDESMQLEQRVAELESRERDRLERRIAELERQVTRAVPE